MNLKKTILVTGATGAQGGSVAEALLLHNKFNVRILTRDPGSENALALKQAGAEIAVGDMNNIESLKAAMKDVYGVFGVTSYHEHFRKEYRLGKNLIDAVHQSGIRHFVFSSQTDYNKLSKGTISVPSFDIKADLKEYAKSLRVPATFVQMSFYYENFLSQYPLKPDKNNNLHFGFPQGDTKLAMVSVTDMGRVVATIFDHPIEYSGRTVGIVAEDRSASEYAYIMSKVLKQNVYYNYITRDVFATYNFPGAEEAANMFEVQRLYIPGKQIDMIESYGLNPAIQSFEKWLIRNKDKFAWQINAEKRTAATSYK